MNQSSLRLEYIDIAKIIGLSLVILSHSVYPQLMFFANGCFVPIFFVTSGYTTHRVGLASKGYRLLMPYLIFSIVLGVLYIGQQWLATHKFEELYNTFLGLIYSRYCFYPLGQADNIYLLKAGNAPLWFLTSMFTAYIALIPLLKWPKMRGGVIVGYIAITWILNQLPILLPWSIDCAFIMAIFIYTGMQLREIDLINNNNWGLWCCILLVYCVAFYSNGYGNLSVRDYGDSILLCLISGILGSCLIMKIAVWIASFTIGKRLAHMGQYTLTMFCIQMPLLVGSRMILEKISLCFSLAIPLVCIAFCQLAITLSLGYAIALIARKIFPNLL